jgi:mevalonate kinase
MDYDKVIESIHELDKRLALQEQKVDSIFDKVTKIADALSWLAKITGASLLGAIVTWIIRGGLNG